MRQAGVAAYRCLQRYWPQAEKILIACGPGNNGGDGYVLARLCHESGLAVQTLALTDPVSLKGDALTAYQDAMASGIGVSLYREDQDFSNYDLIVDALFGTGLQRALQGDAKALVEKINNAPAPVLAIDIPSGLLADTGMVNGIAVVANVTITFIALKQGLFTGLAADYCGQIEYDDLDVPAGVFTATRAIAHRYQGEDIGCLLAPRKSTTHKGQCGHVLAVGGQYGHLGAIRMTAEAALRVGAGLVSVAGLFQHAALLAIQRPEIMAYGIDKAKVMAPLMEQADVLVIGPGMGTDGVANDLWHRLVLQDKAMVVDADGLNLLAEHQKYYDNWILTPHPGEAARLLQTTAAAIQADRYTAVRSIQEQYGGVAVLKGSGTLVCDQEGEISVINVGNPGMASGGMGDVLAGVMGGLLAQGLPLRDAARSAVWVHGTAADQAAMLGQRGLLATDLLPHIRRLVNP